jgi:hypothetical protein
MCLHFLYDICGRDALLPRSLAIPLCYNPTENPLDQGGFANIWKGQYHDQEVAAKVLRVYAANDVQKIRKVGCPRLVVRINELTVCRTEVL